MNRRGFLKRFSIGVLACSMLRDALLAERMVKFPREHYKSMIVTMGDGTFDVNDRHETLTFQAQYSWRPLNDSV